MTNSSRISASLINAECDVLTALGMVSKIPRNAYRMSIDNDVRDSIRPDEHTTSLRLNGAGPKVVAPEDWENRGIQDAVALIDQYFE